MPKLLSLEGAFSYGCACVCIQWRDCDMCMQAAITIVASVIHSNTIGLDVTRRVTIPRSALPSAAALRQTVSQPQRNTLQSSGQGPLADSECIISGGQMNQQTGAIPACSQLKCPSADKSHQPELCNYDPPSQAAEVEQQVGARHGSLCFHITCASTI